jgi:hypothetical protein
MLTDKSTATSTLSASGLNGQSTLTALYTTHHVLHEYLDYGQIYINDNSYPLQKLSLQRATFPTQLNDFVYYWIEQDTIYIKNRPSGTLSFAVPKFPANLSQLPISEEIEAILIDKVVEVCIFQDTAEDGER